MLTMSKVTFEIILATTTESVEDSTTTIDSCNRLNRRAGTAGKGCATTTTSKPIPTIAVVPNTNSANLKLQVFEKIQVFTSPQFFSISELGASARDAYPGYVSGDPVFVREISSLGGPDRAWGSGYTIQVAKKKIQGVVLSEVFIEPKFYLKHLAGIRPLLGTPSPINSVITRGATVKISYVAKTDTDNHNFKVDISSYQVWNIKDGIYRHTRNESDKVVILSGIFLFNYRQNFRKENYFQSFWGAMCFNRL